MASDRSAQREVADELRRQADEFIDIVELQPLITRDPAARPARRD